MISRLLESAKWRSIILTTLRFSSRFLTSFSTSATVFSSTFCTTKWSTSLAVLSNVTVTFSEEPFSTILATKVSLRDAVFTIASNCLISLTLFSSLTAFSVSYSISKNLDDYYKSFVEVEDINNYGEITFFVENILKTIKSGQEMIIELLSDSIMKFNHSMEILKEITKKFLNK